MGCDQPYRIDLFPQGARPVVGLRIDIDPVDVDAEVCLRQGSLELIASTKAGRVHESIVAVYDSCIVSYGTNLRSGHELKNLPAILSGGAAHYSNPH